MKKFTKLTPKILKRIVQEERKKLNEQKDRIQKARRKKKINEIRRELRAFINLKREQKILMEKIKKIQRRTSKIKKTIKEA
jgi:hypothetical protein